MNQEGTDYLRTADLPQVSRNRTLFDKTGQMIQQYLLGWDIIHMHGSGAGYV